LTIIDISPSIDHHRYLT